MADAYCYQCANCYTTLHADSPTESGYYSIITGELCSTCQEEEDDYDDD